MVDRGKNLRFWKAGFHPVSSTLAKPTGPPPCVQKFVMRGAVKMYSTEDGIHWERCIPRPYSVAHSIKRILCNSIASIALYISLAGEMLP